MILISGAWLDAEVVSLPALSSLYLGRRTRLYGERIECFDLPSGSSVRRGFSRSVFGMSERDLDEYWIQQALTGGHLPPRELASAADVVRTVAERPGAIGYMDYETFRAMKPAGVRALPVAVDGKPVLPSDRAYPIRHLP